MTKTTKQSYSFEFKLDVMHRFLAGETKVALAKEPDLSSPKLIETWVRKYRYEGGETLRPKPKDRPKNPATRISGKSEVERLRRENERLRTEIAFLGQVRALREQGRR